MKRLFLSYCLGALGLLGCTTTEVMIDGGPIDPPSPPRLIEIETEPSVTLAFGEATELRARLTEEGEPVVGEPVRFAFEGNAQDATIGDLDRETDVEGRTSTTLVAGSQGAVFRVRASAERAEPRYVNVSVGNMGFGALRVIAPYEGGREGWTRRVIDVYADVECDPADGYPDSSARTKVIDDPETDEATFRTLSAGLSFTVVGRVEGPTGAPLAIGCVSGIEVLRDEVTDVELGFTDAALIPEGEYETELTLETMFFEPVMQLGVDATRDRMGLVGARLYLDALEDQLTDAGEPGAATMLASERMSGFVEASLAMRLDAASEGPSEGFSQFFAALTDRLEGVRVSGPLTLTPMDADWLDAQWEATSLIVGPMPAPDAPDPLILDPAAMGLMVTPEITVTWAPSRDEMAVESLGFGLPIGTLVSETMTAAAIEAGGEGAAVEPGAGCGVLQRWVAESPTLSPVCDSACALAACHRALAALFMDAQVAIESAGLRRDRMSVSGTVTVHDDNADLMIDRIEGPVEGAWSGAMVMSGDEVAGTLAGSRTQITE